MEEPAAIYAFHPGANVIVDKAMKLGTDGDAPRPITLDVLEKALKLPFQGH